MCAINVAAFTGEDKDYASLPTENRYFVEQVYAKGLLNGYSDDTFRGEQNTTRAQTAVVMDRLLNAAKEEYPVVPEEKSEEKPVEPETPAEKPDAKPDKPWDEPSVVYPEEVIPDVLSAVVNMRLPARNI